MDSFKVQKHNEKQKSILKEIDIIKIKNKVKSGIELEIFRVGIWGVGITPSNWEYGMLTKS